MLRSSFKLDTKSLRENGFPLHKISGPRFLPRYDILWQCINWTIHLSCHSWNHSLLANAWSLNYSTIKVGTVDCSGFCRCLTAEAVTKNRTTHQLNSDCRVHHMKLLVTPRFSSFYFIFLVLKLLHSCLKFAFNVAGKHRIVQVSCVGQCNRCVCLWLCRQGISQCNEGVYLWARHFAVLSGVYMGGFILMLKLFQSCLKYAFCVGSKHWIVHVSCWGQCKWWVYLWLGRQGISTV